MNTVLYVVAFAALLCGVAAMVALVGRHRFRGRVTADVTTLFSNAEVGIGSRARRPSPPTRLPFQTVISRRRRWCRRPRRWWSLLVVDREHLHDTSAFVGF